MSEVAKMLGVEIGERFKIDFDIYSSNNHNFDYYLSNEGIVLDKKCYACCSNYILCELLRGNYTINRKPWKPEVGECYHFIDESGIAVWDTWANRYEDILLYKLGNCYRTKEEAAANRDKWVAFYASDKVLEI
jgi:hypothetical protein